MSIGTVRWFSTAMGFGSIEPDDGSADVHVRMSAVHAAGIDTLAEGQRLSFVAHRDPWDHCASAEELRAA